MSARCVDCGARIEWRTHVETGRPAPLDLEPSVAATAVLVPEAHYVLLLPGATDRLAEPYRSALRTVHWLTCPARAAWRERMECSLCERSRRVRVVLARLREAGK